MKLSKLGLVLILGNFFENSHADVDRILHRLDNKINSQNELISKINNYQNEVRSTQKDFSHNESSLWKSISETYEFLKSNNSNERYIFIYEATKASSTNQDKRIEAFREWIKNENQRMLNRSITSKLFPLWKKHVEKINFNLDTIERSSISHLRDIDIIQVQKENIQFLNLLRSDIKNLNHSNTNRITMITHGDSILSTKNYIIFALTCLFFMFASYNIGKERYKNHLRKKIKSRKESNGPKELKITELPSLGKQDYDSSQDNIVTTSANLEDECHKTFEENTYLLEAAELKIYQPLRSPFRTNINADPKQLKEALNWLIKGAIAVTHFQAKKDSYIEWNCKESTGRVFLEIVIHGVECDFKKMYYNALVDGTSSAPAHFGRSEMALEGYLPSISFKSGSNKTTVSLGLDVSKSALSH